MEISSLLSIDEELEEKALLSLLYNFNFTQLKEEWFFIPFYKNLFLLLKDLYKKKYSITLSLVEEFYFQKFKIKEEKLTKFFEKKETFKDPNINYYADQLKNRYEKNYLLVNIEKLVNEVINKKDLDKSSIVSKLNRVETFLANDLSGSSLLNFQDLMREYYQTQVKRRNPETRKSIGSKELDKYLTKPAAPQEMTCIVGRKGSGKSAFKTYLQNNLIVKGIPVVSFELEMSNESNDDRLICSRSGLPLHLITAADKDENVQRIINTEIEKLSKYNNYLRFCEPSLNLEKLDFLLSQAVQIFKEKEVLGEDNYFVVFIDTLDIMEDFDNAGPKEIKRNVNILHRLYKKYNAHFIPILQANENKFRMGKVFKNPEELDYYHVTLEDIEGGSAFAARSRVVLSLNRPLQLKKIYFPERMEEWELELDLLNVYCVKQNDGKLFFTQFVFGGDNFRLFPLKNIKEGV